MKNDKPTRDLFISAMNHLSSFSDLLFRFVLFLLLSLTNLCGEKVTLCLEFICIVFCFFFFYFLCLSGNQKTRKFIIERGLLPRRSLSLSPLFILLCLMTLFRNGETELIIYALSATKQSI